MNYIKALKLKNYKPTFRMPFICIALSIYIYILIVSADLSIDNNIASSEIGVAPNSATVTLSVKNFQEPIYDAQWYYDIPSQIDLSNYLTEPVNITFVNGDKLLTWKIGNMSPEQSKRLTFDVSSKVPGRYTFGERSVSALTYMSGNGTRSNQSVPAIYVNVSNNVPRNISPNVSLAKNSSGSVNSLFPKVPGEWSSKSFELKGQGRIDAVNEPLTNVTIRKILERNETSGLPRITIQIIAPPIKAMDFVMALDSSGSMRLDPDQPGNIAQQLIPDILDYINSTKINTRISLLTWNDHYPLDFVYNGGSISRKDNYMDTTLVPLNYKVENNITNFLYNRYIQVCDENNATEFDYGINSSVSVMLRNLNNKPIDPIRDKRFILFIVGGGEFKNITNTTLINEAKTQRTPIYTLGIGVTGKNFKMRHDLKWISDKTGGLSYTPAGAYSGIALKDAAENITKSIIDDPIIRNPIIVDTLYSYLVPIPGSISGARLQSIDLNRDGTRTMTLNVDDIKPGTTKNISFDMDVNINLPVDVIKSPELNPGQYDVNKSTPISQFSFEWYRPIGNYSRYYLALPENEISIFSFGSEANQSNVPRAETQKRSGIELGLLTLVCMSIVVLTRRKYEKRR